ncbi:iron-sulfur cluster assembly protein [Streptomyces sp. NBC_01476]|uniref:iron-sulfur cluster assembly protein n=1 Tax=Streptomyces sp. NBC_01476 TaxID=2903881 RepID=UPI002E319584|nr:iron-sulfur cluster assembly protein [Streptomyces sp. NBC_01476]
MTAAVGEAVDRVTAVNTALATVLDPELDRPITELGFVRSVSVGADGSVEATLRLPTYFCAPNFAWLMVEDARRALAGLTWSGDCRVILEDHFASDEINEGVGCGKGFADAFPGLADPDRLAELRATFLRKGHLAAQARLGKRLLERGWTMGQLADATLADLPERLTVTLRRRRALLGLPAGPAAPLFADDTGQAVPAAGLEWHLRRARTAGVGITANTEVCEGLLAARYGPGGTAAGGSQQPRREVSG